MQGKVCVITGASSGLGRETALQLADKGVSVVAICRTPQNIRADIDLFLADLSNQKEIRHLSRVLLKKYPKIDILIHNAGVILPQRTVTADGLEATFAVNHLAPFLLTHQLLPALEKAPQARIIVVTSRAEELGEINFKNLQGERSYHWMTAYAQSKLANLLFAYEFARRIPGLGIHCLHPGLIHSRLGRHFNSRFLLPILLRPFMQTPEKAAKALVHLAANEITGKYFIKHKEAKSSSRSYDRELAAKLWDHSELLTKENF